MKELAQIRRAMGLTQKQLAEKAGVDQATISKIETTPSYNYTAEMITKLAEALNVEAAELFGLTELQARIIAAIRSIDDPAQQAAAVLVLETMAASKRQ
ncbi:helix-turn-helix domain-containing protein [Pseudogemmobacter faecipullorum]|uniref:Helix-turn-helix transcriptional regulator n=1 Tax=Pseudogemmobacter faecipullorum TaxID=2755041 RepID=A0ABS8CM53_9RHOB|nr:helix-turn-helix transcriptional regulator [Pseudogemmobacter faecipullorum]MCB5410476.1 helix-turn-helix transcriptional regulator [Pseudogemmobacter faecipullorum]